jgi:hypothetical protein
MGKLQTIFWRIDLTLLLFAPWFKKCIEENSASSVDMIVFLIGIVLRFGLAALLFYKCPFQILAPLRPSQKNAMDASMFYNSLGHLDLKGEAGTKHERSLTPWTHALHTLLQLRKSW